MISVNITCNNSEQADAVCQLIKTRLAHEDDEVFLDGAASSFIYQKVLKMELPCDVWDINSFGHEPEALAFVQHHVILNCECAFQLLIDDEQRIPKAVIWSGDVINMPKFE